MHFACYSSIVKVHDKISSDPAVALKTIKFILNLYLEKKWGPQKPHYYSETQFHKFNHYVYKNNFSVMKVMK